MYEVYINGSKSNLLYSSENYTDDSSYVILSPKISQELGKSGSFTFTVPDTNKCYGMFKLRTTGVDVYKDDELFWRGRVLDVSKDFYKNKAVVCEGILGYLNDTIQEPLEIETTISKLFKSIIEHHNSLVGPDRRFTIGEFTVKEADISYNGSYVNTMSLLQDLIDNYGGFLTVTYSETANIINWLGDVADTSDQVLRFGSNITDLVQNVTGEDIVTCLAATGNEDAGIKSVYVKSTIGCELFDEIWGYESFSEIEDSKVLEETASKYLDELIWASMELTVNAVDLSNLDGYSVGSIVVGKNYKVVSEEHSVNHSFPCSAMDIDLSNPMNDKFTLGAQTVWTQLDDQKDYSEMIQGNAKVKTIKSKSISSRGARTESKVQTAQAPFTGRVVFSDETNLIFENGLLVSGSTLEGDF